MPPSSLPAPPPVSVGIVRRHAAPLIIGAVNLCVTAPHAAEQAGVLGKVAGALAGLVPCVVAREQLDEAVTREVLALVESAAVDATSPTVPAPRARVCAKLVLEVASGRHAATPAPLALLSRERTAAVVQAVVDMGRVDEVEEKAVWPAVVKFAGAVAGLAREDTEPMAGVLDVAVGLWAAVDA